MPVTISGMNEKTATQLTTPANAFVEVAIAGDTSQSYKMSLDTISKKAGLTTVANVTALFARTDAMDNQLFQTLGYSTEGIGANLYRYDAGSVAAIDGVFTLPGIGGTLSFDGSNVFNGDPGTGRMIAVDKLTVCTTQAGAMLGGHDDVGAISRCFESSAQLVYHRGISTCSRSIQVVTSKTIKFENNASINPINGVGNTFISIVDDDVSFLNVSIDGGALVSYDIRTVIEIQNNVNRFTMNGGSVSNFVATAYQCWGIYFVVTTGAGSVNHTIDHVSIANLSSTPNSLIGDNQGSVRGIIGSFAGTPGQVSIRISNCRITGVIGTEDADCIALIGTSMDQATDIVIDENVIDASDSKRGIKSQLNRVTIRDNRISSSTNTSSMPLAAIAINGDGCEIVQNVISGYFASGIDVIGTNNRCALNTVRLSGDSVVASVGVTATGGTWFEGIENTIVSTNTGFQFYDFIGIQIRNNDVCSQYGVTARYTLGTDVEVDTTINNMTMHEKTVDGATITPVSLFLMTNSNAFDITLSGISVVNCQMRKRTGAVIETSRTIGAGACSASGVLFHGNVDWSSTAAYSYRIDGDLSLAIIQVTRMTSHTGEVLRVSGDALDVDIAGCYLPSSFTVNTQLADIFGTQTNVSALIANQF